MKNLTALLISSALVIQNFWLVPVSFAQSEPLPTPVQINNNTPLSTGSTSTSPSSFSDQELSQQSSTNLFQGASQFGIPLHSPKGMASLQPQLAISYSSHSAKNNSLLGFGWNMNLGVIKRLNTNGVDEMYRNPTYYASVGPVQGELVLLSQENGKETYGLRKERSFARIEYHTNSNKWTVTTTSGLSFLLGSSEESRLDNPQNKLSYSWHLDQVSNPQGVSIEYDYVQLNNLLYPKSIRYGAPAGSTSHPFELRFQPFASNSNPTPNRIDQHIDYSKGFRSEHQHLLTDIEVWIEDEERLRYSFNYRADDFRTDLSSFAITSGNLNQAISMKYYNRADGYYGALFHRQYRLHSITFPKGGSLSWDYRLSHQQTSTIGSLSRPHFPVVVVSSLTRNDGQGQNATTRFDYQDPHYYYESLVEKELAGFGRVTVTDPLNNKIVHYFHQGGGFDGASLGEAQDSWALIGQKYRDERYDPSGVMLQRSITSWEAESLGPKRSFIKQVEHVTTLFNDSGQHKSAAHSFTYDSSTGNLLELVEHGEVFANNNGAFTDSGSDDRRTVTSYASNASKHLLSYPRHQQVFDTNNQLISSVQYRYDDLPVGNVRDGNQTHVTIQLLEESRGIETVTSYNSSGQVISTTDPLGNITTLSYDNLGLYPRTVTNALGHNSTVEYDLLYSQPLRVVDPNGLEGVTVLDSLGRVIEQKFTDPDTGQLVTVQSMNYQESVFPHSMTSTAHLDDQSTANTTSYFDGFGRVIQTRSDDAGSPAQVIVTNTVYDALGRVAEQSLPVFASGPAFDLSDASNIKTSKAYDALNRLLSVTDANGTTSFSYDRWTHTMTDALGNRKRAENDAFGRLVKVVEDAGAGNHVTEYEYDSRNQLITITNANSNIRNFSYDSLGRLLSQEDLHAPADNDFGVRSYTYDDNGNVLTTTKADGTVISSTYDALNRPLTQSGPTVSYQYSYDQGNYGIGKLSSVTALDYSWSASYNLRGLVIQKTVSVGGQSFVKDLTYTSFNQPKTLSFPDGVSLSYAYNRVGQIKDINSSTGGIMTHINYSPLSQVEGLSYGNELRSVFTYDPLQMYRLSGKRTEPAAIPVSFTPFSNAPLSWADWMSSVVPVVQAQDLPDFGTVSDPDMTPPSDSPFGTINDTGINTGTVVDDTDTSEGQIFDPALHSRGATRSGRQSRDNDNRDPVGGEIKKPVVTHSGPWIGSSRHDEFVFFRARYENTMLSASNAVKYQVVVEQNGTTVWDSGMVNMDPGIPAGHEGPYVAFDVSLLNDGEASWKIAFELENGSTTPWSDPEILNRTAPIAPVVTFLQDINYVYDSVGNITELSEASGTAATKTAVYEYDDLYRLVSTTLSNTSVGVDSVRTQSYGTTGNILSKSDQGNYSYNQNAKTNPQAVTNIDNDAGETKSFEYDANGNLIREQHSHADGSSLVKVLSWDDLDRIVSIEVTNEAELVSTISFSYDHTGRRLSKTVSNTFGSKTTLYPFADFEVTDENTTKVSVSGNSMHLGTIETDQSSSRIIFSHTDHLGGGNILTDLSGKQLQTLDYFPFGSIRVDEQYDSFDETKKFTGHEFDDSTGYFYAQARYYHPDIGRFVSSDPLQWKPAKLLSMFSQAPQAFNSHSYAGNRPLRLVDPTGENWQDKANEIANKVEKVTDFVGDALTFGTYSKTLDTLDTIGDRFAEEPSFENGVDLFGTSIGGAFIISGGALTKAKLGLGNIATTPIEWGAKQLGKKAAKDGAIETYKYLNPKDPEPIETLHALDMDTGLTDYTIEIYDDKMIIDGETIYTESVTPDPPAPVMTPAEPQFTPAPPQQKAPSPSLNQLMRESYGEGGGNCWGQPC